MGRPKKYQDLDIYAPQRAYFKTEKGKEAVKRYENSQARKINKLEWTRKKRGTIVDKRQWFIDNYGEIKLALEYLKPDQCEIVNLYYGLTGEKPLTQRAIAHKLGISQSQISQIKQAAIKKLENIKQAAN